jgi:hypothetical protein
MLSRHAEGVAGMAVGEGKKGVFWLAVSLPQACCECRVCMGLFALHVIQLVWNTRSSEHP